MPFEVSLFKLPSKPAEIRVRLSAEGVELEFVVSLLLQRQRQEVEQQQAKEVVHSKMVSHVLSLVAFLGCIVFN